MGRNRLNLNGQVFGCWTVLGDGQKLYHWLCRCKCGNVAEVSVPNLKRNSAGCVKCGMNGRGVTHGLSGTPLYAVYIHMMQRCYNENCFDYKYYGGRGISVCEEWRGKPAVFCAWGEKNGYVRGKGRNTKSTLDRADNNGNYCPENCRWVDMDTQIQNRGCRRINVMVEINGEVKRLTEWCKIFGKNYRTVSSRVRIGWSAIDALTVPIIKIKSKGAKKYYENK